MTAENQNYIVARRRLIRHARRLVDAPNGDSRDLYSFLRKLCLSDARPVLFGGYLRDSLLLKGIGAPRDVDIVLAAPRSKRVLRVLNRFRVRATRFGGFVLNVNGRRVDAWFLDETWAIRNGIVSGSGIAGLLRSTSFNVEALAVSLRLRDRRFVMRAHHLDSLGAVLRRELELNLENNPFPQLVLLRAYVVARKCSMSIGLRLRNLIVQRAGRMTRRAFNLLQREHYGHVVHDFSDFQHWLEAVCAGEDPRILQYTAPLRIDENADLREDELHDQLSLFCGAPT